MGLQDLHPPVKVAPDYEKVIAAIQYEAGQDPGCPGAMTVRTNALAGAAGDHDDQQSQPTATGTQVGALAQAAPVHEPDSRF